jgi:hypothetical protein
MLLSDNRFHGSVIGDRGPVDALSAVVSAADPAIISIWYTAAT